GYLLVPVNQSRTITLHYVTPPNVFTTTHGSRYHLVVQHQPGSHPEAIDVHLTDGANKVAGWALSKPMQDIRLSAPLRRRPFTPIPLPKPVRPVVQPGNWIEPHAFLAAPKP